MKNTHAINAFANSDIDESIYCTFFKKWKKITVVLYIKVLLLLFKALYELKQALVLWYQHLTKILIDWELKQVFEMNCLFINIYMLILFYIDDIVVLYEKKHIKQIKKFQSKLFWLYKMRYIEELQWFFEICFSRDRNQRILTLCQNSYIDKLIIKFNLNTASRASKVSLSLFNNNFEKNSNQATAQQILTYQQRVESINFVVVIIN